MITIDRSRWLYGERSRDGYVNSVTKEGCFLYLSCMKYNGFVKDIVDITKLNFEDLTEHCKTVTAAHLKTTSKVLEEIATINDSDLPREEIEQKIKELLSNIELKFVDGITNE